MALYTQLLFITASWWVKKYGPTILQNPDKSRLADIC